MDEKIKVTFWPNGNVTAFDIAGQVPALQESWFRLYLQYVEEQGFDPTKMQFEGPRGILKPFRTEEGWNWSV